MEMRARGEVEIGEDITGAIPPLVTALYDANLHTHCSSCFTPLPMIPAFSTNSSRVLNCSSPCCSSTSSAAADESLLQSLRSSASPPPLPSSDLLAALRLLRILFPSPGTRSRHHHLCRIAGLLTNRCQFLSRVDEDDPLSYSRIREGTKLVVAARRLESGAGFSGGAENDDVLLVEEAAAEAALCLVLTNAVEVQDETGRGLGIAVYDWRFSWINHSCSPNSCYRFSFSSSSLSPDTTSFCAENGSGLLRIVPHSSCVQV